MARTLNLEGSLRVEGLTESIRGLRKVHKELPELVVKAVRNQSRDIVVPEARSRWAGQPIRPSQATSVVKWQADQKGASLVLRYSAHPYAAGVEFGAHRYKQFRSWRGNQFSVVPGASTGYVVQDAIRSTLPRVEETLLTIISAVIDRYVHGA
jgi:hypothetical protein